MRATSREAEKQRGHITKQAGTYLAQAVLALGPGEAAWAAAHGLVRALIAHALAAILAVLGALLEHASSRCRIQLRACVTRACSVLNTARAMAAANLNGQTDAIIGVM